MPTEQDKERILGYVEGWKKVFFIQDWDIDVVFKDKPSSDQTYGDPSADIVSNKRYRGAFIKIYPCFWEESKENQWKSVCHELCHLVTSDYKELVSELTQKHMTSDSQEEITEESTASWIEHIICNLHQEFKE